jgi:hypothetical protein
MMAVVRWRELAYEGDGLKILAAGGIGERAR